MKNLIDSLYKAYKINPNTCIILNCSMPRKLTNLKSKDKTAININFRSQLMPLELINREVFTRLRFYGFRKIYYSIKKEILEYKLKNYIFQDPELICLTFIPKYKIRDKIFKFKYKLKYLNINRIEN